MNQMVGEGFRQLSQMTTNVQDQVKSDALLRSYAGSSGMDVGKLKALLNSYGVKLVEAPMGSNSSILKELPDFMKKFNISTNRTSTTNSTTEPPPVSEMKEDYSSGPNRTTGGMTNSTFTPDSGPMKREAEGPQPKRLRGSSPVPPVMHDEVALAAREENTFRYIFEHPELLAMGLGIAGLAAGAAPVAMGVAAADLAGVVGSNLFIGGSIADSRSCSRDCHGRSHSRCGGHCGFRCSGRDWCRNGRRLADCSEQRRWLRAEESHDCW
jgi:hypothetical protein